jgi:acetylornithine deacetylase/succinyl-diaminopimelate desuccinylase-like protein
MVGIDVRTAPGDLHSGMYGGSVLNAAHVLNAMLAEVMPDEEGMLRPELREGITPPTEAELKAWSELPPGNDAIVQVGGRPLTADSGATYYEHNWANASVDVHGIDSGDAHQIRTIIPCRARAKVSIRLAPGQSTSVIGPRFTELMRAAAPPGAEVDVAVLSTGEPALFDPQLPPLKLAAAALESACGRAPALTRVGGSLPVLAAFAEKGIPVILSGFALPEDAVHAPDESFRLESLRLGELSARALYEKLAELPPNRRA